MITLDDYRLSNLKLWKAYHEGEPIKNEGVQDEFLKMLLRSDRYSDGVAVNGELEDKIANTLRLAAHPEIEMMYEPVFVRKDAAASPDIIVRNGNKWDIIMLRLGCRVKDSYIDELAFVKYCCGIPVGKCIAAYVNRNFTPESEDDFFLYADVTEKVNKKIGNVRKKLREKHKIISGEKKPGYLPRLLREVRKQRRNYDPTRDGMHINKPALKEFLGNLRPPLVFLDFETLAVPYPVVEGTHPYQHVPFQFSLHVLQGTNETPEHHSVIVENGRVNHYSSTGHDYDGIRLSDHDPRYTFTRALEHLLPQKGSIITYNKFENNILLSLWDEFPKHGQWIRSCIARNNDLYEPFRRGYFYHPAQNGLCSLKAVLSELSSESHSRLEIQEGEEALRTYYNLLCSTYSPEERTQKISALHEYCTLDTWGMALIIRELEKYADL